MTSKEFDAILSRRFDLTKKVLAKKRQEYANPMNTVFEDRFHNFGRAAAIMRTTKEQALIGMFSKHLVSILDIVERFGYDKPSEEMVEEKIGDAINYLILLEGMLKEGIREAAKCS